MTDIEMIADFLFETQKLKMVDRDGWKLCGIKNPETIAEHSCGAAYVAFVLAKLEGVDPHKCIAMAALHNLTATRIGDTNKVSRNYVKNNVDMTVLEDQLSSIPEEFRNELKELMLLDDSTKEATISRDADIVEMFLQAKKYQEQGNQHVKHMMEAAKKRVKTDSAKKLIEAIESKTSYDWCKDLRKLDRLS